MTTAIRRRRGTTTQHSTFTGLEGEVTVDTTKDTLVVHDGSTAGGHPLAKENNATLAGNVTLSGGTANGVAYLNGSKVVTTGSALTFNGTSFALNVSGAQSTMRALASAGQTATLQIAANGNTAGATSLDLVQDSSSNGYLFQRANAPLIFGVNNSEAMRLTSTGLGIGTTSPSTRLTIGGYSSANQTPDIQITRSSSGTAIQTGPNITFGDGTTNNATTLQVTQGRFGVWNYGGGTWAERMSIDSSGNLGLGVTPSGTWGTQALMLGKSGASNPTYPFIASTDTQVLTIGSNSYWDGTNWKAAFAGSAVTAAQQRIKYNEITWHVAAAVSQGTTQSFSQAMTLDSSGNLLIGRTTVPVTNTAGVGIQNNGLIIAESSQTQGGLWVNRITSDGNAVYFTRQNVLVGTISVTGSATAYNTSSDYRLKNITGPLTNSGAYIDSLNPVEGTWKESGSVFVGLIAHEVQEASRTKVATGVKDGEEMQAMDYSNSELIANLIAEVKSLRQRLAAAGI